MHICNCLADLTRQCASGVASVAPVRLRLDRGLGQVRREQHPALAALDQRVPGASAQRVDVHAAAAALGTDCETKGKAVICATRRTVDC